MRISDLSRQTGVPVATIKFYLRERLLPPGTPTGRNQALYGEAHLRRLRLIRAFTNIGHLDLSSVREVLAAIENDRLPVRDLFETVDRASNPAEPEANEVDGITEAQSDVDEFVKELGWEVEPGTPSRQRLARVLAALKRLGCECGIEYFTPHAEAAEQLAAQELDLLVDDAAVSDRAAAVVRTVLLDAAQAALRRMAQEHHLAQRFG